LIASLSREWVTFRRWRGSRLPWLGVEKQFTYVASAK